MGKRLSLYGVDPVEALRAALNTPPPKAKVRKAKKKAAKKAKAKK